jgi:ATP phosphoribosyltransferase
MAASTASAEVQIHLALPKGHMQENVFKLMEEAGVKVCNIPRHQHKGYRADAQRSSINLHICRSL